MNIPGIQQHILLASYTTYKIGGVADYFVIVRSKHELASAVIEARKHNVPFFVLGTGANILIGDGGFRGLVIKNESVGVSVKENIIIVESGQTIANLIEISAGLGLSGFEHYAGIPSTVGGALWQNLHFLSPDRTHTVFIESIFKSAEVLDESGSIITIDKDSFEFGYDTSILHSKKLIVLEATFILEHGEKEIIKDQVVKNLQWRAEKQPPLIEFPSCGSVFKKIEHIGAGRLIEQVGLKGHRIGGAQISEKHANFIVNTGTATAKDVREMIKLVQNTVKEKTGHTLETEIGFMGQF
jgi:UDP-N-acetylmuramate dehydrogenase